MASVFKLGRDRKKRHAFWYYEFEDENGQKRMRKGFTDKSLTEQLAVKCENEARLRRMGLIDPVLEKAAATKKSDLSKLLKAYEKDLGRRENTKKHVKLTMGRVRRVIDACGVKELGELTCRPDRQLVPDQSRDEDMDFKWTLRKPLRNFCSNLSIKKKLDTELITTICRRLKDFATGSSRSICLVPIR
jgi:hypothetical protein